MASNAIIIYSTIPQHPIEYILNRINFLDRKFHMMTLLEYHHSIFSFSKATFKVSFSAPTQATIDSWLDKDGRAHTFMLFNI